MSARMKHGRTALARILWLHRLLRQGEIVNRRTAAEMQEVSQRTIGRDLEFMRDVLGIDVRWDGGSFCFFLPGVPRRRRRERVGPWRKVRGDLPDREYALAQDYALLVNALDGQEAA